MKNAREFDDRVTVGGVPDNEDLAELKELGFKTLVDLRDEDEKSGGLVGKRARELGLRYVSIPIHRKDIKERDLIKFQRAVFEKEETPIYAFSGSGKTPLALLRLLQGEGRDVHLPTIIPKASHFGVKFPVEWTIHE
jgi:uncharacterized protein (TIGR01244 family)